MKNRLKALLNKGELAVGAQLRFGTPAVAELFGHAGFDFLVYDTEHAPQTIPGVQQQIQAAEATGATSIVRLSVNDPDQMRVYLDMGASGILAPFVLTAEEAQRGADGLRYPPQGKRGFGPSRAARYGFDPDYFRSANEQMTYIPIIEDAEALNNIDEIFAVDGVDAVVIGPADLSISLGVPLDMEHKKVQEAAKRIVQAAERAGKPAGSAVYGGDMFDPDIYKRFADQGFSLLLASGDEWILNASCRKIMDCVSPLRK